MLDTSMDNAVDNMKEVLNHASAKFGDTIKDSLDKFDRIMAGDRQSLNTWQCIQKRYWRIKLHTQMAHENTRFSNVT